MPYSLLALKTPRSRAPSPETRYFARRRALLRVGLHERENLGREPCPAADGLQHVPAVSEACGQDDQTLDRRACTVVDRAHVSDAHVAVASGHGEQRRYS